MERQPVYNITPQTALADAPCSRCGQKYDLHSGAERFCPMLATFLAGETADALRARIKDLEATLRVRELTAIALLKSAEQIAGAPRPVAVTQLHDASADCIMVVYNTGRCVVRRLDRDGWSWSSEPSLPETPAAVLESMRTQVATFERDEPMLVAI